jgi:hypothetical protein
VSRLLSEWWPAILTWIWLSFVQGVAGPLASFLCGIGMLMVCIVAFYEAGKAARRRKEQGGD